MLFLTLFSLAGLTLASPAPVPAAAHHPHHPFFDNSTIFVPPREWKSNRTSYARTVILNQNHEHDNHLLVSWSFRPPGRVYAPIYESKDLGLTWAEKSKVYMSAADGVNSSILQVFLYELPQKVGKFPRGTVLLTANAIPDSRNSTNIQMYASLDKGLNFNFVSDVAVGGPANTTNGATPVWEPMILMHDNNLGVFYSDSRDPLHGQKLAHQTTTDLINWGPVVNDAAPANYTLRPGMTTISEMGNGKFIFSYEVAFAPEDPINAAYAVHYRIADSPFDFDNAEEILLKATNGDISSSGPQTIWTPYGGPNGTVVTLDSHQANFFVNHAYGARDRWIKVKSGHPVGYTRDIRIVPNTEGSVMLITNGGLYGRNETTVTCGDWKVPTVEELAGL